jgi:hypothetical protein
LGGLNFLGQTVSPRMRCANFPPPRLLIPTLYSIGRKLNLKMREVVGKEKKGYLEQRREEEASQCTR